MLPWVLLGVFCVCQATREAKMCYGSDADFPFEAYLFASSGRLYFTPTSPAGPRRLVRVEDKFVDSRYKMTGTNRLQLLDVTKKDEGEYSTSIFGENNTFSFLVVTVKDCDRILKKVELKYGRRFSFELPGDRFELAFSPPDSPFQQVVLWNGTKAGVKGRGKKIWFSWELEYLTQRDSGYYTMRNSRGKFVSRTQLIITEHVQSRTETAGMKFVFHTDLKPERFIMTFTPEGGGQLPVEAMRWGRLQGDFFSGRLTFDEQPYSDSYRIVITDVEQGDAGRFTLRDENGNLGLLLALDVEPPDPPPPASIFTGVCVFILVLIALVCCCRRVKDRCCKTTSKPDTSVNTPDQPAIYHPHSDPSSTNQPFARCPGRAAAPPYPSQPSAASSHQPPPEYRFVVDSDDTTANVTFPQFEVCAGRGGPAPSFPLGQSSDSGTQFELPKGLGYSSALLSSDTPTYDTYTSDKMNFL